MLYSFCLLSLFIKDDLQLLIIQTCMACALLLKAGIFPIYNYILNRHTKANLPYSILIFGLLPYLGVLTFEKFVQNVNISNEIFLITLIYFIAISPPFSKWGVKKSGSRMQIREPDRELYLFAFFFF